MSQALKALGIAILVVLMSLSIATIYFKHEANTVRFHPLETGYFAKGERVAVFAVAPPTDPRRETQSLAAFEPALKLPASTVIWVDVQFTKDRAVVARRVKEFEMPKTDPPSAPLLWAQNLTLDEIKKLVPTTPTLGEVIALFPKNRFIVSMVDYPSDADLAIVKAINDAHAGERTIVYSAQDRSLADIRKLQPMWLYGSSYAQVSQFLFLANIGLENLAPMKADVYITPLHLRQRSLVRAETVSKVHQRGIRIIGGPTNSLAEGEELKSMGIDGLISADPAVLETFVK